MALAIFSLRWDLFLKMALLLRGNYGTWHFHWDKFTIPDYEKGALWGSLGNVEIEECRWVFSSDRLLS